MVNHIKSLWIAEEISFVVDQRVDDRIQQIPVGGIDERDDESVQCGDAMAAHDRLEDNVDPPQTIGGEMVAGPRFEERGENALGIIG